MDRPNQYRIWFLAGSNPTIVHQMEVAGDTLWKRNKDGKEYPR
jgi:hypothetical protein